MGSLFLQVKKRKKQQNNNPGKNDFEIVFMASSHLPSGLYSYDPWFFETGYD